jgi:hypothetical protein
MGTCLPGTASELQTFFTDHTMSRDIATMLRVYLEIAASSLAQKRDDLQDEIKRLKQELLNTAFHKEQIEELDAKMNAINQVMWSAPAVEGGRGSSVSCCLLKGAGWGPNGADDASISGSRVRGVCADMVYCGNGGMRI